MREGGFRWEDVYLGYLLEELDTDLAIYRKEMRAIESCGCDQFF